MTRPDYQPDSIAMQRRDAADRLRGVSSSPKLDAEVLLCDVLLVDDRSYLFAHPEQILSAEQRVQYAERVNRRLSGEPIAYIRGFRDWYDRRIIVTPDVLIPRPETELLLEAALEFVADKPDAVVVDVCTGSGAIAICLKANAPQSTVAATDNSSAVLNLAKRNADAAGVDISFWYGDLLQPVLLRQARVDVLISNPPYIPRDDLKTLEVAKYEPTLALDGGIDGLDFIRRILLDARSVCNDGALILIEHGAEQGDAVLELAQKHLDPAHAEIVKDYAALDRFLLARL